MVGAEEQRGWTWTSRASLPWQNHYSKDREQLALLPALVPRLSLCSDPLRTWGQPKGLSGLSAQPVDRHNPGMESSGSFTGNEPEAQNNKPPGTARSQGQPPQAELRGYFFSPCFRNFNSLSPHQGNERVLQCVMSNITVSLVRQTPKPSELMTFSSLSSKFKSSSQP